jgi:sugar/nucleoside kinase (ribokinase family)
MRMKKVVTIGEIVVEVMATEPGRGFLEPLSLVGPFPSGAPAIFIDQVGRLGQPCGMVGRVGDDDFGRVNLDRLAADGVDVSAIAVDPAAATGSAFVRYRPDGDRDFVFNIRQSANAGIALDDAARALIAGADHLHVMGSSLFSPALVAATEAAVAAIKAKGGTVSFDPNIRRELLDAPGMRGALAGLLARCDLFLPSGPELMLFAEAADEAAAIAEILARGVRAVVVKRGAAGADYHDGSGLAVRQPGFAVEELDPTGAGDCFGAAFVVFWLRGLPPAEALRFAAAAGARAVTRRGPMEGASTQPELEAFMAAAAGSIAS